MDLHGPSEEGADVKSPNSCPSPRQNQEDQRESNIETESWIGRVVISSLGRWEERRKAREKPDRNYI